MAEDANKNFCLILSNMKFSGDEEDLFAYQKDVERIKNVFSKDSNFELLHENDKTAEEMESIVEQWSEMDFSNSNCVIFFILSHGKENGIIFGTDEDAITVDFIQRHLDDIDDLKGKPKIIFVQACRGILKPVAEDFNVASKALSQKKFPDFFTYYSTTEDYVSYVHKQKGTFFIKSICDVLEQSSGNQGLDDLVFKVNEAVSRNVIRSEGKFNIQSPEVSHTLSKDFKLGFNRDKSLSISPEYHVRNKNPCIILVNTKCSTHDSICRMFNQKLSLVVETLQGLNFDAEVCFNLTNKEIKTKFKTDLEIKDCSKADCFAIFILSCGCRRDNDLIYGSNGLFCHIDTVHSGLIKNRTLLGKPKVIFLVLNDCTKLQYKGNTNTDGSLPSNDYQTAGGAEKIGKRSDIFRYVYLGTKKKELSLFIENLCAALTRSAKDGPSLTKTVFKVNESTVHNRTLDTPPEVSHTLTKEVFFHHVDSGGDNCLAYTTDSGIHYDLSAINKFIRSPDNLQHCAEREKGFISTKSDESMIETISKFDKGNVSESFALIPTMSLNGNRRNIITKESGVHAIAIPTACSIGNKRNVNAKESELPAIDDAEEQTSSSSLIAANDVSKESNVLVREEIENSKTSLDQTGRRERRGGKGKVETKRNVLLKDFKPRHIAQVSKYLDKFEPPLKNWIHLAKLIFHDDAERLALVNEMKIRYIGGSGGKSLLDNLNASKTLMTVDEFVETAEDLERMDIIDLFIDLPGDTLLKNIEPLIREKLINLLDIEGDASVKNWRSFVTELDLNEDEVFAFIRKGGSPTKELIKLINSVKVNFTLDELRACLKNIGRMDVNDIVSNIIDDIQFKKKR